MNFIYIGPQISLSPKPCLSASVLSSTLRKLGLGVER